MLQLRLLNWAMIGTLSIPFLATVLARWATRHTRFFQRPDLGIVEEHQLLLEGFRAEREAQREDEALRRTFPCNALPHQCCADLERTQVEVLEDGAVRVSCAVAGCGRTMVIGHAVAPAYFVEVL